MTSHQSTKFKSACLTAVGFLVDEEQTPLICREKVIKLLAAKDLVVTCKCSFKQNMLSHQPIKLKCA